MFRRLIIAAALFVPASTSQAQGTHTCLTPHPLSSGCNSFVMFNAIGAVGLARGSYVESATGRTREDLPSYGAFAIGYMRNIDSSHSIGASAELGAGVAGRFSAKGHWRLWKPRGSVDFSAGPLVVDVFTPGNGGDARSRSKGATADVALVARNGIGVFAGGDVVSGAGRTSTGLHAGLHLESGWAVGAAIATAGLLWAASRALSGL